MGDQAIALRASPFEQLSTPVAAPYRHLLIEVLRRPVEFAQYTSQAYTNVLASNGVRSSLSRPGNCWDNAVAESLFSTLTPTLLTDADGGNGCGSRFEVRSSWQGLPGGVAWERKHRCSSTFSTSMMAAPILLA